MRDTVSCCFLAVKQLSVSIIEMETTTENPLIKPFCQLTIHIMEGITEAKICQGHDNMPPEHI